MTTKGRGRGNYVPDTLKAALVELNDGNMKGYVDNAADLMRCTPASLYAQLSGKSQAVAHIEIRVRLLLELKRRMSFRAYRDLVDELRRGGDLIAPALAEGAQMFV